MTDYRENVPLYLPLPQVINLKQVWKYIGCPEKCADSNIVQMVRNTAEKLLHIAKPRGIFCHISINGNVLCGTKFQLEGIDILKHLANCHSCFLIAVTLGANVDTVLRTAQVSDMQSAVIFDSCATVLVEQVTDGLYQKIQKHLQIQGQYMTKRFSPGYGDFPVSQQKILIKLLDAPRKIGLTVTEHAILAPCKSLTGIIGVSDCMVNESLVECDHCILKETCHFRKEGTACWKK